MKDCQDSGNFILEILILEILFLDSGLFWIIYLLWFTNYLQGKLLTMDQGMSLIHILPKTLVRN